MDNKPLKLINFLQPEPSNEEADKLFRSIVGYKNKSVIDFAGMRDIPRAALSTLLLAQIAGDLEFVNVNDNMAARIASVEKDRFPDMNADMPESVGKTKRRRVDDTLNAILHELSRLRTKTYAFRFASTSSSERMKHTYRKYLIKCGAAETGSDNVILVRTSLDIKPNFTLNNPFIFVPFCHFDIMVRGIAYSPERNMAVVGISFEGPTGSVG